MAGMMDIRRGVMAGGQSPIPTGYVTDGLLLWLDGIRNTRNGHDAESPTWEDLSGHNRDYSYPEAYTIRENGLYLPDPHYGLTTQVPFTEAEFSEISENQYTVEMVAQYANLNPYCVVFPIGNRYGNLNFGRKSGVVFFSASPRDATLSAATDTGAHYYNSHLWIDGARRAAGTYTTTWSGRRYDRILAYDNTNAPYSFYGVFYALRVYNRTLSNAELYRNWRADKARFGL